MSKGRIISKGVHTNMKSIPDELLIEACHKAIEMKLDNQFISLIKEELKNRSIIIEYIFEHT